MKCLQRHRQNFARDPGSCRLAAFSVASACSPGKLRASQTCSMRITAFCQEFAEHHRRSSFVRRQAVVLRFVISVESSFWSWTCHWVYGNIMEHLLEGIYFFSFCRWNMWCKGSSFPKSALRVSLMIFYFMWCGYSNVVNHPPVITILGFQPSIWWVVYDVAIPT